MNAKLLEAARTARENSYSPYSQKKVGAAILTQDGRIFSGCNVENASFGGTICAERTAVLKAVSEGAKFPIQEVLVVVDEPSAWPPCGLCRQVIAEFASSQTKITTATLQDLAHAETCTFAEIMPKAFLKDSLK